jgi:hypothetical protein
VRPCRLPSTDELHGRFYRKCALVASAGVLLRSQLGEAIDAHDMVMRFNAAPTKVCWPNPHHNEAANRVTVNCWYGWVRTGVGVQGYEHYVGRKTSYRISNGEHLGFRETDDESVIHHLRSHSFLVHLLWFHLKFPTKVRWPL